jgi:fumarate reductase flavoprotein subunit
MNVKGIFFTFMALILCLLIWGVIFIFEPTEVADVVVIGAGASGMSASIEAHDKEAKVILLEKMPYVGGNTLRATAGINGVGTSQQIEQGIVDYVALFKKDTFESGHDTNNIQMIEILASESKSAIDWLTEMGMDLTDVGILAGHSVARTHRPSGGQSVGAELVRVLYEKVKTSDIDLRLENKAVEILTDKTGAVSGVIVEDKSGKSYKINTKKVIIATGGFGGSPEVFVYYNQKLKGYNTTNSPSATGDFIGLVKNLKVKLVDMDYIQTHPTVSPQYGILITEALRGNGGILVNNSGKRFADEMKNRDLLSTDILGQNNKEVYLIFNEAVRTSLAASDDYIDMDIIIKGETVAELASALRLDQLQLEKTVADYNQYVALGVDEAFNRQSLKVGLETGPFYAVQVIPAVHYCMGGILIDEKTRAITESGKPLEGLFASGEATGGIHGLNRLGGNSLLDAVVFGRIAGKNAVE